MFEATDKKGDFESDFKTFYLELFTGGEHAYYQHTEQVEVPKKGFARIIEFTPLKEGGAELDSNKLLKVSSRVLYKRGTSTGEALLESFIGMKDSLPAEK